MTAVGGRDWEGRGADKDFLKLLRIIIVPYCLENGIVLTKADLKRRPVQQVHRFIDMYVSALDFQDPSNEFLPIGTTIALGAVP